MKECGRGADDEARSTATLTLTLKMTATHDDLDLDLEVRNGDLVKELEVLASDSNEDNDLNLEDDQG